MVPGSMMKIQGSVAPTIYYSCTPSSSTCPPSLLLLSASFSLHRPNLQAVLYNITYQSPTSSSQSPRTTSSIVPPRCKAKSAPIVTILRFPSKSSPWQEREEWSADFSDVLCIYDKIASTGIIRTWSVPPSDFHISLSLLSLGHHLLISRLTTSPKTTDRLHEFRNHLFLSRSNHHVYPPRTKRSNHNIHPHWAATRPLSSSSPSPGASWPSVTRSIIQPLRTTTLLNLPVPQPQSRQLNRAPRKQRDSL